jgi:hypothetical protein
MVTTEVCHCVTNFCREMTRRVGESVPVLQSTPWPDEDLSLVPRTHMVTPSLSQMIKLCHTVVYFHLYKKGRNSSVKNFTLILWWIRKFKKLKHETLIMCRLNKWHKHKNKQRWESLKKITVKVQEPPSPTLWKQTAPWLTNRLCVFICNRIKKGEGRGSKMSR